MRSKRNKESIHFVNIQQLDTNQNTNTIPDKTTYREFIKSIPIWKQSLVKQATLLTDSQSFIDGIVKHNKIIIATDGGIYHESGTFGVVISNTEQKLASNKGKLYANHFYQSPFRSEIHAILAGIITVEILLLYHNITFASINNIEIICDNKKVVERLQQRRQVKRTTNQHTLSSVDIEMQILDSIVLLEPTTNLYINHIPGHQDKKKQLSELSYNALLNIDAHRLCLESRTTTQETYHEYPTSNINMTIEHAFVNAKYAKIVKRCYHSMAARYFYQKKYLWSNITINSVWWLPHANSLRKLYIDDRVRIQKFIHNRLPTNKRQKYRHPFKCNKCANCHLAVETENHIILCQTYSRQQLRQAWINELSNYLSKPHTPVNIKEAIIANLSKWLESGKYIANIINVDDNNNLANNNNNNNNNINTINNIINNIINDDTITNNDNINNNNNNNCDDNNKKDEHNIDHDDDSVDDYNDYDNNHDDNYSSDDYDNDNTNNKYILQPKDHLTEAIIIQQRIGWSNFIRGRLAIEWGAMINIHLTTIDFNKKFTAEIWATNIIDINYKNILKFWETRNSEEHGTTAEEIENNNKKRLLEEAGFIISSMQSWASHDRQYLSETLQELESKPSRQLEIWLSSARILQQTLRQEAKSRKVKGTSQQKQQLEQYYPIIAKHNNKSTSTIDRNNVSLVDDEGGNTAEQSAPTQINNTLTIVQVSNLSN